MANFMRMLVVLPLFMALCVVSAYAQPLVSVDCGRTGTSVGYLGLTWSGDEQYVQTGQIGTIKIDKSTLIPPLATLRYFPTGKKNCYTFPGIGQGSKILIRAWFTYGNYDGLSSPPVFSLQFDGNSWSDVTTSLNSTAIAEMIYVTKVDNVSLCVAQTRPQNVPFISCLEIRRLGAKMYTGMDVDRPLQLIGRYAYGSNSVVRYPDDTYDRGWLFISDETSLGLTTITSSSNLMTTRLVDQPPAAVLRQAVTPSSSSASKLVVPILITSAVPVPHYVVFYFLEVSDNGSRAFTFLIDDKIFYSQSISPNRTVLEIYNPNVNLSASSVFTLVRDNGSALPPSINAAEFYRIGDYFVSGTESLDVKALGEFQRSYVQLQAWSGDPCLPIGYAWDWINCSSDPAPRVTALKLSGYGLTGSLADFSGLTALQTIDLHNNSLSGNIPEFLGKFTFLTELNLADNQFNGSVPSSLTSNSKIHLNISGNNLSGNSSDTTNKKKSHAGIIAGAVIASFLFLLLVILAVFCIFKKKPSTAGDDPKQPHFVEPKFNQSFTYAEIQEITNNFEKPIGEGGSGNVYYGRLANGTEVAVKEIKESLPRGTKEFVSEVELLMTVHHKCLVSFVGYCNESGKLILLYEYMSGGNLRQLLSGRASTPVILTWEARLQMALNVATGLDYLHSGCHPAIIHRDVKTTNILLNGKKEAKVADFGLSKAGSRDDVTHLSTVVAGTPGYIDPEYYSTNLVTKKSDVYSFGVVLFELMTGCPPFFNVSDERFHIVQWATARLVRGDIHNVADPKLRGQYNVNSMWKVADIAMSCTSQASRTRPHMSDVVNQLREAVEVETYQQTTDTSFTEVQHSSSSNEFSSSSMGTSYLPPAR
ncbi:probable LRR receptor-like serine/threonine-protein kinase PAM74 isoform X2 [Nymphaea colorata]|uniref:probable LRR receptor-like serine/threonine-protein kinase PAM74 isoform X2 n=1 Tax=Nymphaea colorata TaxID=210225 RepID=UPI00214DFDE2|nr:probable LRR receptor-like serine/threonine-protein kinase PAM74 isoform X2 [Nymphaea colorata]